jgi:Protein of unknown function (DUF3631)
MTEGQKLLQDVYDYTGRFVVFPDEASRVAHTLWVAHTHLMEAFYTTPRLLIRAPIKGCGKSRLAKITRLMVHNEDYQIIPTAASLYTSIELSKPTLLIDEINRLYSGKDTHEITAVLEAGFEQDGTVPRVSLEPKRHVERFKVFTPVALIGIDKGNIPDTVLDRSIQINLKKRLSNEIVEKFRPRKHKERAIELRERLEAWAAKVLSKAIEMSDPIFPPGIEDREADKCEPLFVVADVADVTDETDVTAVSEPWGIRARRAALELLGKEQAEETPDYGQLVLLHLKQILDQKPSQSRWKSEDVLSSLWAISDAPWSDFSYGKPLSAAGLSKLLRPFGIRPKTIRFPEKEKGEGDNVAKGYYRTECEDAFKRYLSETPETPVPAVTEVTAVTGPLDLGAIIKPGMTYQDYCAVRGLPAPEWPD